MHSLPLARALESQLTAEQSLTGRRWNSPKKIPYIQRQRRSHNEMVEGRNHNKIKSHNCWVGDSQTGEQLYHWNPPTGVKVLSPMSGYPTWGSGNGRRNSHRNRLWRLAGFDCRTLTGLGEQRLHSWREHTKLCAHQGRSSDPIGDWTRPTCSCWRVSCRGVGWLWLTVGTRTLAAEVLGSTSWHEPSISPTKEPVAYSARLLQAKQPTGRKLNPPISRKAD